MKSSNQIESFSVEAKADYPLDKIKSFFDKSIF